MFNRVLPAEESTSATDAGRWSSLTLGAGLIMIGLGQTVLYTVLGPAARQIGISDFQTGIIVSFTALVLTVASPLWGRLIDRYGSRAVYLVGMLSYAIGSLVFAATLGAGLRYAFAPVVTMAVLLSVRAIYAVMTAGIHPAAMAYIARNTPEESRASGMALMSACNGIGFSVGPLVGSTLSALGLLAPLFFASFLAFITALLGWLNIKKDRPAADLVDSTQNKSPVRITDGRVLLPLCGTALVYTAFSALQQSVPLFIQDIFHLSAAETVRQAGIAVAVLASTMIVTQLGIMQYFKPGPVIAVSCGTFMAVLGLLLMTLWSTTLTDLAVSQIFVGCGFGLLYPGFQATLSNAVSIDKQGSVAGLAFGAASFGYVVGPLMGTGLLALSHHLPYMLGCVAISCACILALWSLRKRQDGETGRP